MATIEREIKLAFESADAVREGLVAAGGTLRAAARLQRDYIFDTTDARLKASGHVVRLRDDGGTALLTVKGPRLPGAMKMREECETVVADASVVRAAFQAIGLLVAFRYEKYREEWTLPGVVAAIDETPVGTFVELEGEEAAILAVAAALGRGPADFITSSYRTIYLQRRAAYGLTAPEMVFPVA